MTPLTEALAFDDRLTPYTLEMSAREIAERGSATDEAERYAEEADTLSRFAFTFSEIRELPVYIGENR